MTQKERIAKLEAEVAELKLKISLLEARPMVIPVSVPAIPTPQPWTVPNSAPMPTMPLPYIGDPVYPTVTCKSQVQQNVASGTAIQNSSVRVN